MRFVQQTIANYDDFKEIIWHGEMYRLASPYENDLASLMYVNEQKTEGVMFNYLTNWRFLSETSLRPILLQGLDKNKTYKLTEINLYDGAYTSVDSQKNYSGEFLMNVGFNPSVNLRRTSVIIKIESIK